MRTAVVDVGGGLRGVYATGVLDRCLEEGVRFDAGVGRLPRGARNIASYLAGKRGGNYQFYAEYSSRREYMSVAQRYGKAGRVDSMLSLHLFPLLSPKSAASSARRRESPPSSSWHWFCSHCWIRGEKAAPEKRRSNTAMASSSMESPRSKGRTYTPKACRKPVQAVAGPCFGRGRPGRNPGCPGCAPKMGSRCPGEKGCSRR